MNKKIFRLLLLVVFSFSLYSCIHEDFESSDQETSKKKFKISEIKNNKILNDSEISAEITKIQVEKFKSISTSKSLQDSILDGVIINTENVLLVENGTQKTYTFPIKRSFASSKIENLVLKKNADSTFSGALLQYDLTNEEKALMLTGHYVDLTNKIKFYDISKISINQNQKVVTEAIGCLEITWENGVCASGQHAYGESGCTLSGSLAAGSPTVISVVNTCGGGGGNPGSNNDPNFPGGGGGSEGGNGGSETTPYDGDLMTLPPMLKNDSDCNKAKAIYNNTAVKSRYESLQAHTRDGHETGYGFKTIAVNGTTTTQTEPLNPDTVSPDQMHLVIQGTSFGYVHTHIEKVEPKLAVKIFSPADINTFLAYLHNAKQNSIPFGNIFGGMLAEEYGGNGTNFNIYQIQYNGNGTDLPPELTEEQKATFRNDYLKEAQAYLTEDFDISHYNMQKLFFKTLKKMNLKDCVLFKIKNGIRKKITLDENGEPKEELCA
ncbi:hypothetical protein [Chryseobacterium sp. Bi04]|uniref:hypothetical protein n=1 Tax=Chryseobacterium sp. Bi04 TaxID=2822345 RepID=UPI001DBF022D|nr:hypothetical protein [Chryseobacterium sp. Bi04]CAH0123706.1 hypothetical protein SRABI04_00025 [Chryseobacterium sp. Bi04]